MLVIKTKPQKWVQRNIYPLNLHPTTAFCFLCYSYTYIGPIRNRTTSVCFTKRYVMHRVGQVQIIFFIPFLYSCPSLNSSKLGINVKTDSHLSLQHVSSNTTYIDQGQSDLIHTEYFVETFLQAAIRKNFAKHRSPKNIKISKHTAICKFWTS